MRIKVKKPSLLVKLIALILIVYATVTLVSLQRQLSDKQQERQSLEAQITHMQQANADLTHSIDALDTDAGVEAVARDKFGLVSKGEVTFYDIGE